MPVVAATVVLIVSGSLIVAKVPRRHASPASAVFAVALGDVRPAS